MYFIGVVRLPYALLCKCAGLCPGQLTHELEEPFPVQPAATVTSPPQLFHTEMVLLTGHFCESWFGVTDCT